MKKIEINRIEMLQGGKVSSGCTKGTAVLAGGMCAAIVFTGLWGLTFAPSCLALAYTCFS